MRLRLRGFSLIEILITLALLSVLLGFAVFRHGSEEKRASSTGLAELLVSELRAARSKAVSSGKPVALCFPTDTGGKPHSQSWAVMCGTSEAKISRIRDLSSTFSDAFVAVGYWGSSATINRPASDGPQFKVESWLPAARSGDYCLVFNSDGTAWSNDLPLVDGRYAITVCSGLEFTQASPGGTAVTSSPPTLFLLDKVSAPQVIRIEPDGGVSLSSDNPPGLNVSAHTVNTSAAAAALTRPTLPAGVPMVVSVKVLPEPLPGESTQVAIGKSLAVVVEATDSEGGDLFIDWNATLATGLATGVGSFSVPARTAMVWDAAAEVWRNKVTWVPPSDGVAGDTFDIQFTLTNDAAMATNGTSALLTGVELVRASKMLLSPFGGSEHLELETPGGVVRPLLQAPIFSSGNKPRYSPDGTKVAWFDGGSFPAATIEVANSEGGSQETLANATTMGAFSGSPVAWNHLGTKLYFADGSATGGISVVTTDGVTAPASIQSALGSVTALDVSSDGEFLACISTQGISTHLYLARLNPSTGMAISWTNLTATEADPMFLFGGTTADSKRPGGYGTSLAFDPSPPAGKQILIYESHFSTGWFSLNKSQLQAEIDEATATATLRDLTDNFGNAIQMMSPAFSPAGDEVVFVDLDFPYGVYRWTWNDSGPIPQVQGGTKIDDGSRWFNWVTWR
jgi:prepilin-type N-terminal cleavage/methylation domain-containing protein